MFSELQIHRIKRIQQIHQKRSQARQNRPWVPHAGGQDDGSLHELPQLGLFLAIPACHGQHYESAVVGFAAGKCSELQIHGACAVDSG